MEITFIHQCPSCQRRLQLNLNKLGRSIKCVDCGRLATARDPELESAALLDSMKVHAELATQADVDPWRSQFPR
jgi:hypothetical protein